MAYTSLTQAKNKLINSIDFLRDILPGVGLVTLIGFLANSIGREFPLIGGAVFSIIIGLLVRNFLVVPFTFNRGIDYTLKKLLKVAIILLGFGFSFTSFVSMGFSFFLITLLSVVIGIFFTFFIARLAGLQGNIPLLVGLGTGICGATAIATTAPIVRAKEEEMAYAINTIFLFNIVAVLVYPLIGRLIELSDLQLGVWVGAAIHDTSSVVAAGYAYSHEAGDTSVAIKLIRTLALVPVAVILSFYLSYQARKSSTIIQEKVNISKIFPYFILAFVGAAMINTLFLLPVSFVETTTSVAKFLIVMVMASVGLGTDVKKIKSIGIRPLLVGFISSVILGLVSLTLIYLLL
ncbi:YeiH family protein [Bacillus pinisoli]|uniref:YeiH family protein n=1 Tax=Bacillus pinisoli TaxID=2901866 RepID=UPI001FF45C27|nr:putative sulfate exporter family transporter [Bacillus pinisoli]